MSAFSERSAAKRLHMKKTQLSRVLTAFLIIFPLLLLMISPVSATETTQPGYDWTTISSKPIENMFSTINYWYHLLRNFLAPPFLAVGFAACGFQIIAAASQNKPWAIDAAVKNLFSIISGTFLLFALPAILNMATDILKPLAWKP